MRKSIKITILTFVAIIFSAIGVHTVNAAGGCENPGPYGICLPNTSVNTESIPTTLAIIVLSIFLVGSIMYIGSLIWEQNQLNK